MGNFIRLTMLTAVLALGLSVSLMHNPGLASADTELQVSHGLERAGSELPVQAVDDDDDHHGMWGDWDSWGWWLFMVPMMLVFWGGLIWLVVWLVRQSSGGASQASSRETDAVELARRRYARGEISREEFDQIRRDLST